jgi:hypothetical protein
MNTLKELPRTLLVLLVLIFSLNIATAEERVQPSGRTVIAEVVAFDQAFQVNRLGSSMAGKIFALRKDVQTTDETPLPLPGFNECRNLEGFAGRVHTKDYKRARPIVLRANLGDILEIRFTNLLTDPEAGSFAGCRVMGLSLAESIDSDSSWVGKNDLLLPPPPPQGPLTPNPDGSAGSFAANAGTQKGAGGPSRVYRYFVDAEGVFILYSAADPQGNNGNANEVGKGLFGSVIVQPPNAEYYRSQVLRTDLHDATYHSGRLPENMRLHRAPVEPGKSEERWFLTTYRTRLRDFVTKNVEVIVGDPEKIQQASAHALQSEIGTSAYLKLNPKTLTFEPLAPGEKRNVQAEEEGREVLNGYIYSRDTRHPLIDYGTAYPNPGPKNPTEKHARPAGWPVLEMLYPEVKAVLKSRAAIQDRGIALDSTAYKLSGGEDSYYSAITQLDTGAVPRELWPVLNAWGITSMPGITRVAPQRGYFGGKADIGTGDKTNYIWLLTGVNVTTKNKDGALVVTPSSSVIIQGDKLMQGDRIQYSLSFLQAELQLFHSDLTAIITGPQAEGFGHSQQTPSAYLVPALPARAEPYREFALGYHNNGDMTQAFAERNSAQLNSVLKNGNDNFGINYGIAGISTEILANRLDVGPQGVNRDGVDLKFEEFFLSSWAVGDPAMLVDRPANAPPRPGATNRATQASFADDPSNVYHSYMRDHVKMRIFNVGESAPHVHHLHAHQWLRTASSDESSYLDSQLIIPGSAFTLEITYNGSGNRNQTVGDSIFHCHFYPHFAQGMWSLWRVHDVFEEGTPLNANGSVVADQSRWVRALPDGEINTGTPIPALVPLPTLAMPPIPPKVRVTGIPKLPPASSIADGKYPEADLKKWIPTLGLHQNKDLTMGRMAEVMPEQEGGKPVLDKDGKPVFSNPGFPFFVPGVAGHRPPHPPLDMGWEEKNGVPDLNPDGTKKFLDGGLPRHQVLGGQVVREFHTPWDFTKDYIRYDDDHKTPADGAMVAYQVPEDGTPIEKAAMKAHATRTVKTVEPDGRPANFIHNGLPPVNGAPFADPGVDDQGNAVRSLRKYKAAVIQKDVVLNKAGAHYPQQRFLTLWQDVKPTFDEKRPAQPFFFRANSGETVEYWHTNLVPEYYELDDFQVRTPTDIIGQHIHLVKFDVLASDGAVNGFNYEDGTTSPDDVRGRIYAITRPWEKKTHPANKYSLFELSVPKPGMPYAAGVNWSKLVDKDPVPTPWNGSYLQWQMSQEKEPLSKTPDVIPANFPYPEPPAGQNWDGAMTTIQRFSTDPLLNNKGIDRTVRTVFTHDHFGPSTHQQAGLYAGFLVEPEASVWRDPVTGGLLYDAVTRTDGGPTGWEAIIEPPNRAQSYREFAIEFQDLQLAYSSAGGKKLAPVSGAGSVSGPSFGSFAVPVSALPAPTTPALVNKFQVGPPVNLTGCATTKDATTVTCASTEGLLGGMTISGTNIPPTASVSSITNGTTFVMTVAATGAGTNLSLTAQPTLTSFLVANGVSLTPAAVFVFPPTVAAGTVGIVDDGDQSLYKYPANTVAFSLQQDVMNTQLLLKPVHLETWSVPNTAINPPGAPQIISSAGAGTYSVNYRSEPLSPGRVTPLLVADCATQGSATVTCANTAGLLPGMSISGTVIPGQASVTGVTNATTFVMSNAATATGSGLSLTATNTNSSATVPLAACSTTKGSTSVTCASTANLLAGMTITDAVIPSPASISSVTNGTTFVMTAAATGNVSGLSLTAQPIPSVALTGCATTKGSTTVTCASTAGLFPGMSIGGANIPSAASVSSITNPTTFVMSTAAIDSGSNSLLTAMATPSLTRDDMALAFASIERGAPWNLDRPDVKVASADGKVPPLFARPVDPARVNGPWHDLVGFADKFGVAPNSVNDGKISNWDPYTPLLRGYQGDKIQIRALVGAHTVPHSFSIHGVKWLAEMTAKNSGFKNGQEMGISEHYEFQFDLPPASTDPKQTFADYLYAPSSGSSGLSNGVWGIMRSYDTPATSTGKIGEFPITHLPIKHLWRLPESANSRPYQSHPPLPDVHPAEPDVEFTVAAVASNIVYNSRGPTIANSNGIVYIVTKVRVKTGDDLKDLSVSTAPGDPFILRAHAGDWIKVILNNQLPTPPAGSPYSTTVGLHPQLVGYDVSSSDGANVGFNPNQVIQSGTTPPPPQEYWWYAGDLKMGADGKTRAQPRELGVVNLCPAAPLNQDGNGLLGALIVEPQGAVWNSRDYVTQAADILNSKGDLLFRDFVLIEQTNISATTNSITLASSAVNNRSEDLGFRLNNGNADAGTTYQVLSSSLNPRAELTACSTKKGSTTVTCASTGDLAQGMTLDGPNMAPTASVSSITDDTHFVMNIAATATGTNLSLTGNLPTGDPRTPIFTATAGDPVRFRVLQPGGDSAGLNIMFEIHGHSWQQEPWVSSSRSLGNNVESNVLGADVLVPNKALNILIDSAGGPKAVPGDYLYYNYIMGDGAWGIFRVMPKPALK